MTRPRYTYKAEDGRSTAILELPEGYQPPAHLYVPLVPSAGSGYEVFTNPTPIAPEDSTDD